jgi:hypothetical protein
MSLINEALKRAKQAQASTPPPPQLEFRTVDRAAGQQRNQKLMLWLMMGVVVLLAALLIWQMVQPAGSRQLSHAPDQRLVVPTPAPAPAPAPEPAPAPAPAHVPEPKTIAPRATAVETAPVVPARETAKAATSETSEAPAVAAPTAETAQVAPQASKPAPKLQSIVYNPRRPSAMINGRIVYVGDKFGDWRIIGIDQESATLVGSGVTNVLVLQQ